MTKKWVLTAPTSFVTLSDKNGMYITDTKETTGGYLANDKKQAYNVGRDNRYSEILTLLILRISDYFLASEEEVKKGVADVMGGTVLQLESERLLAEGIAEGIAQGGLAMLITLAKEGAVTIHAASEKAGMTEAEFSKLMEENK